jgi:hypothetical protein
LCALERVRRMEHLAGSAAAAAINQPRLLGPNPAWRVALRSMASGMRHGDRRQGGCADAIARGGSTMRHVACCALRLAIVLWIRPGHTGVPNARIPR